jgi:hypothetical protein
MERKSGWNPKVQALLNLTNNIAELKYSLKKAKEESGNEEWADALVKRIAQQDARANNLAAEIAAERSVVI